MDSQPELSIPYGLIMPIPLTSNGIAVKLGKLIIQYPTYSIAIIPAI
jgi:hypothetical protein